MRCSSNSDFDAAINLRVSVIKVIFTGVMVHWSLLLVTAVLKSFKLVDFKFEVS